MTPTGGTAISRGLSASDTPGTDAPHNESTPEGSQRLAICDPSGVGVIGPSHAIPVVSLRSTTG